MKMNKEYIPNLQFGSFYKELSGVSIPDGRLLNGLGTHVEYKFRDFDYPEGHTIEDSILMVMGKISEIELNNTWPDAEVITFLFDIAEEGVSTFARLDLFPRDGVSHVTITHLHQSERREVRYQSYEELKEFMLEWLPNSIKRKGQQGVSYIGSVTYKRNLE